LGGNEGSGSTAYDASGNGNDGTLQNMETGDWVTGHNGNGYALDFDGTNEIVEVSDHSSLNLSNMTIAFWIKGDSAPGTSATEVAIDKQGTNYSFWWSHPSSSYKQTFSFAPSYTPCQIQQALSADTWYHIAMSYDMTNMRIYVDGSLDNTVANTETPTTYSYPLGIGRGYIDTSGFPGKIDDVRVFNRALSADEIARIISHPYEILQSPGPEYLAFSTGGEPPVGITSPILSSYGIHSSVFGGQVITG